LGRLVRIIHVFVWKKSALVNKS